MKRVIPIFFLFTTLVYSQTDFWSHYSLDQIIYDLYNYDDSVFIGVSAYDIIKSTNRGLEWYPIFTIQDTCIYGSGLLLYKRQIISGEVYLIVSQRNNSSTCPQPPVYFSTNSGQNWNEFNLISGNNFRDITILSNGTFVYISSDTTYYSVDHGTTWYYFNIPVSGKVTKIESNTNDWIYLTKHYRYFDEWTWTMFDSEVLYRSTNFGQTWNSVANTSSAPEMAFFTLFCTKDGETIASEGPWNTETYFDNMIIKRSFPLEYINSAVTIDDKYFFASDDIGLQNQAINFSDNSGKTWTTKNEGLSNISRINGIVKDNLGFLYIGTNQGIFKSNFSQSSLFQIDSVNFSTIIIGDTTYNQINIINPLSFNLVVDSLIFQNAEFFVVGPVDSVLEPGNVKTINLGFAPAQTGRIFSKLTIKADIVTDDLQLSGESPTPTMIVLPYPFFGNVQIGDTSVVDIKLVNESVNKIFIDTMYLAFNQFYFIDNYDFPVVINSLDTLSVSVYFIPLGGSIPIKRDSLIIQSNCTNSRISLLVSGRAVNPTNVVNEELISSFNLFESYPNPFNPTTTIEYQVPKTSNVKISVFNLVGEEITVLVDEEKVQGKYKVEFNGTKLSSGVYFYKMQSDNFISTKKFVLLK